MDFGIVLSSVARLFTNVCGLGITVYGLTFTVADFFIFGIVGTLIMYLLHSLY